MDSRNDQKRGGLRSLFMAAINTADGQGNQGQHRFRSAFMAAFVGIVIAAIVLPLFAFTSLSNDQGATQAANVGRATSYGELFSALYSNYIHLARDFSNATASSGDAALQVPLNEWSGKPEIKEGYSFDPWGGSGGTRLENGSVSTFTDVPPALSMKSNTILGRALKRAIKNHEAAQVLSFAYGAGPLGDMYFIEPMRNPDKLWIGAVVLRVDNKAIIDRYISTSGAMLVAWPFVLTTDLRSFTSQHHVPVLSNTPASVLHDRSIMGSYSPVAITSLTAQSIQSSGDFDYQGTQESGGAAMVAGLSNLHVQAFSQKPTFGDALTSTLFGGVGIVVLFMILAGIGVLLVFEQGQIKSATASAEENRSRLLTDDIISVSQALSAARDGDLTVEIPPAESEVGLISVMVNGLLGDYSQMVAGIIRASQAVQAGAMHVDEQVRSIVGIASNQTEQVAETATTVEDLAQSATEVQSATARATELAAEASRSVQRGQDAVGRIGEAVDSIKEAAIGTTREFKRLQEDSIRLTALVASVKSNAENLDMQAANATLEARHLGTETGSAFATNIGRLARQAQETLADAETAVRSVVSSIDAVNRRIERISEQVRLGVEEVRSVRANFDNITTTNQSLAEFIEQVASSAQEQASDAQQVAQSIVAVADTFKEFNDLLIASSDEMANMRLIVADLQESVANLNVDEELLADPSTTEDLAA